MSKTSMQVQNFLATNSYQSKTVQEMIWSLCDSKGHDVGNIPFSIDPDNGISASDFADWYDNGFGAGDVVEKGGEIYMLGKTHLNRATIVAKLENDKVVTLEVEMPTEGLKMAKNDICRNFEDALFNSNLQFSHKLLKIVHRYIPETNELVLFSSQSRKGIGVVREVNKQEKLVELYCYFLYESKEVGYSMHEKDICNLREYTFESLTKQSDRNKADLQSFMRKLKRELEKHGKTWNRRLHRVEPVDLRVSAGGYYWYVNEKLQVIRSVDRGTSADMIRANAGNYFKTQLAAMEAAGRAAEFLKDLLAK
jgi:hypothetical protein